MFGRRLPIVLMVVLALALAACGPKRTPTKAPTATSAPAKAPAATSAPAATPTWAATTAPGDPAEGWKLFTSQTINGNPGCITCHSLKPGEVKVGPSLADIATDAAKDAKEAGMSTPEMLEQMIVNPNADIAEGFQPNIMPQDWGKKLSKKQLYDLIAFLMTLKEVKPGDAKAGEKLFKSQTINGNPGCITCHSLKPGEVKVGPSLAGIATDAAGDAEEAGMRTEEMLRQMIVNPNADIAKGFQPNIMPQDWGKKLTDKQINDLIAFLMTLK